MLFCGFSFATNSPWIVSPNIMQSEPAFFCLHFKIATILIKGTHFWENNNSSSNNNYQEENGPVAAPRRRRHVVVIVNILLIAIITGRRGTTTSLDAWLHTFFVFNETEATYASRHDNFVKPGDRSARRHIWTLLLCLPSIHPSIHPCMFSRFIYRFSRHFIFGIQLHAF